MGYKGEKNPKGNGPIREGGERGALIDFPRPAAFHPLGPRVGHLPQREAVVVLVQRRVRLVVRVAEIPGARDFVAGFAVADRGAAVGAFGDFGGDVQHEGHELDGGAQEQRAGLLQYGGG